MGFDAIVVGVGGMGSAVAYHLARRGVSVLGIEQFGIPHDRGSSHGTTRIIRLAYWEHPDYVPLVRRAYTLWQELAEAARRPLLMVTGSIDAGAPGSPMIKGAIAACKKHGLRHELLRSRDLSGRFQGYRLPEDHLALYQPDGGFLLSEECIITYVSAAAKLGAKIHTDERVIGWTGHRGTIVVRTNCGTYESDRLILTVGPWLSRLLPPDVSVSIEVERQVVLWTRPVQPDLFDPKVFPVFYIEVDEGRFYGFPLYLTGFKIGRYHHLGELVDADTVDRVCSATDEEAIRPALARYFPEANGPTLKASTCLFSNTADEHFVIGQMPSHTNVIVAGGFSGHGFKFCSVVGEIVADLTTTGRTDWNIDLFRVDRPAIRRK